MGMTKENRQQIYPSRSQIAHIYSMGSAFVTGGIIEYSAGETTLRPLWHFVVKKFTPPKQ
jgi:hypothetical protein